MMNLRETPIARIDFAVDGTELDDAATCFRSRPAYKPMERCLADLDRQ